MVGFFFFPAVFTILETREKLLHLMFSMWMRTGAASYGQAARARAVRNKFEEKLRTPHPNITPPPRHATIPLHTDATLTPSQPLSVALNAENWGSHLDPQCLVKEAVCKGLLGWVDGQ